MEDKKRSPRYAPEVRERAVRMVFDHAGDYPSEWAAIESVAGKLVMKWKTPDRVIDRIVEYSVARAKKGEAFLR